MCEERRMYEVAIIGGGCAGAATALTLLQAGIKDVILVEKNDFSGPRVGETIQPPTSGLLKQLGAWEAFMNGQHFESSGSASAWGTSELAFSDFIFKGQGKGWHLNRNAFDNMLLELAERSGASVFRNTGLSNAFHDKNHWVIDCRGSRVKALFAVDATGRFGSFSKQQGSRKVYFDDLHGVYTYWASAANTSEKSGVAHTLVESVENGWWYSARLPDNRLAVAFMTDKHEIKADGLKNTQEFLEQLTQASHTARRIREYNLISQPAVKAASSYHLDTLAGDRWLAVGDSASAFDPLSSYGIHKALYWGIEAGRSIAAALKGDSSALKNYESNVKQEFESFIQMKISYYQMETRWPDHPFWKSRQTLVGIHPLKELKIMREVSVQNRHWNRILPEEDLNTLIQLCETPKKAYELVRHFQENSCQKYPDWRVVQAVTYLFDMEALG